MTIDRATFEATLEKFLAFLNQKAVEYNKANGFKWEPDTYTAQRGPKNVKIVINRQGDSDSRSVYCFLDYQGNIYKSASWKAPAKHIRGSIISDPDFSWGRGLGNYGATYLR